MGFKWRKAEEEKAVELYVAQRLSGREVAKRIGKSLRKVQDVLKKHGATRDLKEARKNLIENGNYEHPLKINLDTKQVIKLYIEDNNSLPFIANKFGCSLAPLLRILKENNISTKSPSESHRGNPGYWKGKKRSDISKIMAGRNVSKRTRERLSKSHLGQKSKAKGKTYEEIHGKKLGLELRKKVSDSHKGIPSPIKGMTLEDVHGREKAAEIRDKNRRATLKLFEEGRLPKKVNTLPERLFKAELLRRGYVEGKQFIHQYKFADKFMCDFCFPDANLIIEVDGDFFHANPKLFDHNNVNPGQQRQINRDKAKNAYIMKYDNGTWTLLRFWESAIKKNVGKVVDKMEIVCCAGNKIKK